MFPPAIPLDNLGYVNTRKVRQVWHSPTWFVTRGNINYFTLKWYGLSYFCTSYSYYDKSARVRQRTKPDLVKKNKRFSNLTVKVDDKGRIHCDDGPAVVWKNEFQSSRKEYYLRGKPLTFAQFYKRQKKTEFAAKIIASALGQR